MFNCTCDGELCIRPPMLFTTMPDREDIQLDLLDWKETDEALQTKWRFSAVLTLPWRPRLAASGATTHVFSKVSCHVSTVAVSALMPGKGSV